MATGAAARDWLGIQARITAVMALCLVVGFSFQLATGRSSFTAPPVVHAHALLAFGWTGLTVAQAMLAARGQIGLHRTLGWLGTVWIIALVPAGILVMIGAVQQGRVPFFFRPQYFALEEFASLLAFAGLALWAVARRRDTGWHRRLHLGALACLMGPGIGRLLPMPLMMPWAMEIAATVGLLFPLYMVWRERRAGLGFHPAWLPGLLVLPLMMGGAWLIADSPVGGRIHAAMVAGTAQAGSDGRAYPPPAP